MKYLNKNTVSKNFFFAIPHEIFAVLNAVGETGELRIYCLLRNRINISKTNEEFYDKEGNIFCFYKWEDLAKRTNSSIATISRKLKILKDLKIIDIVQQGIGQPAKIYFGDLDEIINNALKNPDLKQKTAALKDEIYFGFGKDYEAWKKENDGLCW